MLMHAKFIAFLFLLILGGCQSNTDEIDSFSYNLGVIGGFGELVNAGVKQLALSNTMSPEEMDVFLPEAQKIADKNNVKLYREPDLLITDLFPADVAKGKEVLLIYQGTTLEEYLSLKADKAVLESKGAYKGKVRQDIARRFGRILSYSPQGINQLLAQNTSFRTMNDFGIRASNVFLYYQDLPRATDFYANTLGLEMVADYKMATIFRVATSSYFILVDASKGMHSADEPKTVALALLTDQLDGWWTYLNEQKVPIKYTYKPKDGGAHDGFVAIDPEGYLLEFERFKQHPENERFIPVLNQAKSIPVSISSSSLSEELGFKATITWLYYKDLLSMQGFYEEVLGLSLVADQGWTKIYQVCTTGFIGLVDERRGMHQFTEQKGVTVSFILDDIDDWFNYVKTAQPFELRSAQVETGPEEKYRAFVGYDPEGYFLEFDLFQAHADNSRLMEYLYD